MNVGDVVYYKHRLHRKTYKAIIMKKMVHKRVPYIKITYYRKNKRTYKIVKPSDVRPESKKVSKEPQYIEREPQYIKREPQPATSTVRTLPINKAAPQYIEREPQPATPTVRTLPINKAATELPPVKQEEVSWIRKIINWIIAILNR